MPAYDELQTQYLNILNNSPYMKSVLQPGQTATEIEYYCYNGQIGTQTTPLAFQIPQSITFDTQADSDFAVSFITGAVQEAPGGGMFFNENVALQFLDTATGKTFFNVPTVMGLVTGAGGFPFVLPAPRILRPNTTVQVTAINRDAFANGGQGPVTLFFALHGVRVFYAS